MQSRTSIVIGLVFICVLAGCSSRQLPAAGAGDKHNFLMDGSVALARPIPAVSNPDSTTALAFLPVQGVHAGLWLSIQTASGNLVLMEGEAPLNTVKGEGIEKLKAGTYQLLHKQRNALWYAPDSYFESRKLSVPTQGDKQRFRRGALGDFVLFINKDTPIHSGPLWLPEIGGVKLDEGDISRIYYRLPIGATIEVK